LVLLSPSQCMSCGSTSFLTRCGRTLIYHSEGRGVERIAELEPASPGLVRRQNDGIKSGTVTGNDQDTISTFGLATCPGLAASGTAARPGGVNKGMQPHLGRLRARHK
jgi:hypothetical protein